MLASQHENDTPQSIPTHPQANQRQQGTVRAAMESDFEGIMQIENSCFPGHLAYSRRQMRYLLFKANSVTLVEEDGGRITGYVTALFRNGSGIAGIETIGVSPDRQGKGVGHRLLRAAEETMARRGAAFSRLEVSAGNDAAIAMYRKAGYDVSGSIPDYYIYQHHGTRAAYRMEKKLPKDCPGTAIDG